ncbi:hypothetical protein D3C72_1441630 [compost metagenome]
MPSGSPSTMAVKVEMITRYRETMALSHSPNQATAPSMSTTMTASLRPPVISARPPKPIRLGSQPNEANSSRVGRSKPEITPSRNAESCGWNARLNTLSC